MYCNNKLLLNFSCRLTPAVYFILRKHNKSAKRWSLFSAACGGVVTPMTVLCGFQRMVAPCINLGPWYG